MKLKLFNYVVKEFDELRTRNIITFAQFYRTKFPHDDYGVEIRYLGLAERCSLVQGNACKR